MSKSDDQQRKTRPADRDPRHRTRCCRHRFPGQPQRCDHSGQITGVGRR